jgi:hypothetical protein
LGFSSEVNDKSARVQPFSLARLAISEKSIRLTPLPRYSWVWVKQKQDLQCNKKNPLVWDHKPGED